MAAATATLSERNPGAQRNDNTRIGCGVDLVRHAGRFAPEQQHVVRPVAKIEIGQRRRGCEQHEATAGLPAASLRNRASVRCRVDRYRIEVIHAGAAESAIGRREASRLDDVGLDAEARAEAQNCSGVLRDVGLVEGDAHGRIRTRVPASAGCAILRPRLCAAGAAKALRPRRFRRLRWHTCALAVRVPIKRRRIGRFDLPQIGCDRAFRRRTDLPGAVRSADGAAGKTDEGGTGDNNLRSGSLRGVIPVDLASTVRSGNVARHRAAASSANA